MEATNITDPVVINTLDEFVSPFFDVMCTNISMSTCEIERLQFGTEPKHIVDHLDRQTAVLKFQVEQVRTYFLPEVWSMVEQDN